MARNWRLHNRRIQCATCRRVVAGQHASALYCGPCSYDAYLARQSAIRKVSWAIKTGKLPGWKGRPCFVCLAPAIGYEHRDYAKPLSVRPICKSCNWILGAARTRHVDIDLSEALVLVAGVQHGATAAGIR